MGVVSDNWLDRVLLSTIYMLKFQTLTLTDVQAHFLGTPLAPLKVLEACRPPCARRPAISPDRQRSRDHLSLSLSLSAPLRTSETMHTSSRMVSISSPAPFPDPPEVKP